MVLLSQQDEDLAMIAAQQYYIDYGRDINAERLRNLLPSYIPDYYIQDGDRAVDRWVQLVFSAFRKVRN